MIVFEKLGRHGRLGNCMFQFAAIKSLAKHLDIKAKIPIDLKFRIWDNQQCLLPYFKLKCETYNEEDIKNFNLFNEYILCPEGSRSYTSEILKCLPNTSLYGYFENMKYFENIKEEIKNDFEFVDESIVTHAHEIVKPIKEKYLNYTIIGIHIRRGDMIVDQETIEIFLHKAITEFQNIPNKVFFVFSGGNHNNDNTNDLEWCKKIMEEKFNGIFYFSENIHVLIDFAIMINCCDHLILTCISTLGWWAAYLNKNKNKKVVCPNTQNISSDYWPSIYVRLL